MFKPLNNEELVAYADWARGNYIPGTSINTTWHPAVRLECEKMNLEEVQRQPRGGAPF
jgi:hypothetical protein